MSAPQLPVPTAIAALTDQLAQDMAGATVTAERTSGTRWRVTAQNDRVRVWMDYEVKSRGRLMMKASELFIDDSPAPRASGYSHLMRIFADPDAGPQQVDSDVYDEAVEVDLADAPAEVRAAYAQVVQAPVNGLRPVLRRANRHWYVCLDSERVRLRITFVQYTINHQRPLRFRGSAALEPDNPLTLVIDGEDLTGKVQGRLDRALGMVVAHQGAPPSPGVARESRAAVDTGVQVRKQTVIRT